MCFYLRGLLLLGFVWGRLYVDFLNVWKRLKLSKGLSILVRLKL
jgi:hypothetical protein